jgi:hypothetical protein
MDVSVQFLCVWEVFWSAINLAQPAAVTVNTHIPWCVRSFHSHPILWHQTREHFQKTEISSNSLNKYNNWYCYQFHWNSHSMQQNRHFLCICWHITTHEYVILLEIFILYTGFSFPFISALVCFLNQRICFYFLWKERCNFSLSHKRDRNTLINPLKTKRICFI